MPESAPISSWFECAVDGKPQCRLAVDLARSPPNSNADNATHSRRRADAPLQNQGPKQNAYETLQNVEGTAQRPQAKQCQRGCGNALPRAIKTCMNS